MDSRAKDPKVLSVVMPVAREVVTEAAPPHRAAAKRMLRALVPYLIDAYHRHGTLDPTELLAPDPVEQWAMFDAKNKGRAWRQDCRGVLTHLGQIVNPSAWPPRKPLGSVAVKSPYGTNAEASWRMAASRACRPGHADEAFVVVASAGAGMSGPEILAAVPDDIVRLGNSRLAIQVRGRNRRLVPIRRDYTELAEQALEAADGEYFISCRDRNAVHRVAERLAPAGGKGFSLRRARSTFLAAHLRAGTPLAAIPVIAGPVSANTLTSLLTTTARNIPAHVAVQQGLGA